MTKGWVRLQIGSFQLENDWAVEPGSVLVLFGPSGSGKTMTLRTIAGLLRPQRGYIQVGSRVVYDSASGIWLPPHQRRVGYLTQHYHLFPHLTVAGNIAYGLKSPRYPLWQRELSLPPFHKGGLGGISPSERVRQLVQAFHLDGLEQRRIWQLSGGQQQRVALARALAFQPQVLLLDEPLSALDAKIRVELRSEIRRIQQQLGITTIYVTHDQEEALSISDRIVVMSAGKMEQVGTPFEIYNFPQTSFTASFVGQLNLIPVTVADAASGRCTFDGQTITVGQRIQLANGAAGRLALRPEELNLGGANGDSKKNQLSGRVETVTFLGSVVRIRVDVGGAIVSLDLFNERQVVLPKTGEQVTVNFPVDSCWVME